MSTPNTERKQMMMEALELAEAIVTDLCDVMRSAAKNQDTASIERRIETGCYRFNELKENLMSETEIDWKARAEKAEAKNKELELRIKRCDVLVKLFKMVRGTPEYLTGINDTVGAFMELLKGKL